MFVKNGLKNKCIANVSAEGASLKFLDKLIGRYM